MPLIASPDRIAELSRQLKNRESASDAAFAIGKLAEDSETTCLAVAATAGLFESLVSILRDGSADAKVNAAWALAQIAQGSDNNVQVIGSIPGVFENLSHGLLNGPSKLKETCALALGCLATEEEHRTSIGLIPGVLPSLAALIFDGTSNAKANAALALGNLSVNCASNARELGKTPGLFDVLRKQLTESTEESREDAAFAISSLCSEAVQNKAKAGEAHALIETLFALSSSPNSSIRCRANALLALGNMAKNHEENCHRIGGPDENTALFSSLLESNEPDLKSNSCHVIACLCHSSRAIQLRLGADQQLLTRLSNLLITGNKEAQSNAAYAFGTLSAGSPGNQERIGQLPSLFVRLVGLLGVGSIETKGQVAFAIGHLSQNEINRQALGAIPGIFDRLISLLATGSPESKGHAAFALARLAESSSDNTKIIGAHKAVHQRLAAILSSASNPEVAAHVALALADLAAESESNRKTISEVSGTIDNLCKMVANGSDRGKSSATLALAYLSLEPENRDSVLKTKVLPGGRKMLICLAELLRTPARDYDDENDDIAGSAALLLGNLLDGDDDEAREEAARIPALFETLSELLTRKSPKSRAAAGSALALGNASRGSPQYRTAIGRTKGVITGLVRLLHDGSLEAKSNAALAIGNLVCDSAVNIQAVGQHSAVFSGLVELMGCGNEDARAIAVCTIGNLAKGSEANKKAVGSEPHIFERLAALLDDKNTREDAAFAVGLLVDNSPMNAKKSRLIPGTVERLLVMLCDGCEDERQYASVALGHVLHCDNDEDRQGVAAVSEVMKRAAQLLVEGDSVSKATAAFTLSEMIKRSAGPERAVLAEIAPGIESAIALAIARNATQSRRARLRFMLAKLEKSAQQCDQERDEELKPMWTALSEPVLSALLHEGSISAKRQAVRAVLALVDRDTTTASQFAASSDAIEGLAMLLESGSDHRCSKYAASTLKVLATKCTQSALAVLKSKETTSALARTVISSSFADVADVACDTLAHLADFVKNNIAGHNNNQQPNPESATALLEAAGLTDSPTVGLSCVQIASASLATQPVSQFRFCVASLKLAMSSRWSEVGECAASLLAVSMLRYATEFKAIAPLFTLAELSLAVHTFGSAIKILRNRGKIAQNFMQIGDLGSMSVEVDSDLREAQKWAKEARLSPLGSAGELRNEAGWRGLEKAQQILMKMTRVETLYNEWQKERKESDNLVLVSNWFLKEISFRYEAISGENDQGKTQTDVALSSFDELVSSLPNTSPLATSLALAHGSAESATTRSHLSAVRPSTQVIEVLVHCSVRMGMEMAYLGSLIKSVNTNVDGIQEMKTTLSISEKSLRKILQDANAPIPPPCTLADLDTNEKTNNAAAVENEDNTEILDGLAQIVSNFSPFSFFASSENKEKK